MREGAHGLSWRDPVFDELVLCHLGSGDPHRLVRGVGWVVDPEITLPLDLLLLQGDPNFGGRS